MIGAGMIVAIDFNFDGHVVGACVYVAPRQFCLAFICQALTSNSTSNDVLNHNTILTALVYPELAFTIWPLNNRNINSDVRGDGGDVGSGTRTVSRTHFGYCCDNFALYCFAYK